MVGTVLIVCPENESRGKIVTTIQNCGLHALPCSSCHEAYSLLQRKSFTVLFCSDALDDGSYQEVIEMAKPLPVIVLSRFAEWEPYMAALRAGAFDYVACPADSDEVQRILKCALEEYWRLSRAAAA